MKFSHIIFPIVTLSLGITFGANAETVKDKSGRYFLNAGAISNFYKYKETPIREGFSSEVVEHFKDFNFDSSDEDYVNYSVGLGYYYNNDLSFRVNYSSGLDIGFLEGLLTTRAYDIDMKLIDLDATYHFYRPSSETSFYVLGGIAHHRLSAAVDHYEVDSGDFATVARDSYTKTDAKIGFGLQWQTGDNWALNIGYTHYNYMTIDKYYVNLEYLF